MQHPQNGRSVFGATVQRCNVPDGGYSGNAIYAFDALSIACVEVMIFRRQ